MGHSRVAGDAIEAELRRAGALAHAGQLDAAAAAYRALLAVAPDVSPAHANLGFVLLDLQRYAEAATHLASALTAQPDAVSARVGLAWALQKQAQWRVAAEHYRQALERQPDHAQAMLGLGTCLQSQGQLDAAATWFERAALADPDSADAYYLLSLLRRFDGSERVYAQCEVHAACIPALPPLRQARYWFALGKLREDAARFDAAFAAYASGNRARASLFVLDETDADAWLARTRAAFSTERLAAYPASTAAAERVPVFVVGMPRSGTTLVEQILASHPCVHGAGEIADLQDVVSTRAGPPETWPESVPQLTAAALRELGAAYVARVFGTAAGATHVVNKATLNYRHVGLIRMLLPRARIIHVMRDPLDTCFSCFAHLFDGDNLPYSYDLDTLARYYVRYAKLMRHWRDAAPGAMLEVRYEDLVRNTKREVRRMLDYLGLPWDARCLAFHRNPRVVETASRMQVRQPVYTSSIGRWRHFAHKLKPLRDALGPCLRGP